MPRYWLCVTNEENWRVVKKRLVWGVSERYREKMESVEVGDFLIFYVKPKRIFSSAGFPSNEVFPYRVRLEPVVVPDEPVDFVPLIEKLSFIVNKRWWTGYFRQAMRVIPKEDFKSILDACGGGKV